MSRVGASRAQYRPQASSPATNACCDCTLGKLAQKLASNEGHRVGLKHAETGKRSGVFRQEYQTLRQYYGNTMTTRTQQRNFPVLLLITRLHANDDRVLPSSCVLLHISLFSLLLLLHFRCPYHSCYTPSSPYSDHLASSSLARKSKRGSHFEKTS